MMLMQRRANAQEYLESPGNFTTIIPVQLGRPIVDCKLPAQSSVYTPAVKEVAHITKRSSEDWENSVWTAVRELELVRRFFYTLQPCIKRVASALKVGLKQKRLGFTFVSVVILSPHESCCPIRVMAQRLIIYNRSSGAVTIRIWLERLRTLQITV